MCIKSTLRGKNFEILNGQRDGRHEGPNLNINYLESH